VNFSDALKSTLSVGWQWCRYIHMSLLKFQLEHSAVVSREKPQVRGLLLSWKLFASYVASFCISSKVLWKYSIWILWAIILILDSTRVQMNALGHVPTPLLSVKGCYCYLRLFPGESHSLKTFLDDASPVCPWPAWSPLEPRNLPVSACCGIRWWSIRIRSPSQRSLLSLIMFCMQ